MKHVYRSFLAALMSAVLMMFPAPAHGVVVPLSDYTANSSPASSDLLFSVDVSDTTMSANGTTKKLLLSALGTWYAALEITETNKTLTSPTITGITSTGGSVTQLTAFGIRSSGASFDLEFATDEVLTGNHVINWNVGDDDRSITLNGNLVLAGSLTTAGEVTFSGAYAATFTLTAATTVTFPTTGTLATLAGTETLTGKTINLANNTVTGTKADFNTALSDDDFAVLGANNAFTTDQTIHGVTVGLGASSVSGNVVVGSGGALGSVTSGGGNNAFGAGTLADLTTGTGNTGIGGAAMPDLTSGIGNTAVGYQPLFVATSASQNVAVGTATLYNLTTGSYNIGIGYQAGVYQSDGTTVLALTGDSNIFIGKGARGSSSNAQTNSVTIGDGAVSDGSNSIVFGNSSTTTATRIEGVVSMPDGIRASGVECQTVTATSSTSGSTATVIPFDNTIPQSTEGVEFLTVTITPTSASSTLEIDFDAFGGVSTAVVITVALFQDSGTDAIQVSNLTLSTAGYTGPLRLKHTMTAGTTSATTFKIRYGPNTGTGYILRNSTGDLYSTARKAILRVREIRP